MRTGLLIFGLALLGLGLLAVAACQYFSPTDGPGLAVEGPDRDVSDCIAGQTTVITFPFHNGSRHSVQIVGLAPC